MPETVDEKTDAALTARRHLEHLTEEAERAAQAWRQAIADLADDVGALETAKRLNLSHQRVYQLLRKHRDETGNR